MFKDVGKQIKGLVKIFMIICCIAGGVSFAAVAIFAGTSLDEDEAAIAILPAMGCLVGFPIIGWLGSILLFAFGELVDKVCDLLKCSEAIINCNQQVAKQIVPNYKEQDVSFLKKQNPSQKINPYINFNLKPNIPNNTNVNKRFCKNCGTELIKDSRFCSECGQQQ